MRSDTIISGHKIVAALCLCLLVIVPATVSAQVDSDGDGIANTLELEGFRFNINTGEVESCDPSSDDPCFVTDPLSWSSDGDPYSDFQEASGVNMDASVQVPYNNPLVAAYPVIEVVLDQYTFTSNATITDATGESLSSGESFSSSVESTTSASVTVSASASVSDGFGVSGEATVAYSETQAYGSEVTSGKELTWDTATSTDLDEAGTLSLSLFARNSGGATALDVRPTFNIYIGGDLVATIYPDEPFRQSLAPGEESVPVVPLVNSNPLAVMLSFDRLVALQTGAPVTIEVVDIDANIQRWRPEDSNWECGTGETCSWTSFQNQILPRTLRLLVDFGYSGDTDAEIPFQFRGNPFEYRVYTGSPSTSPDFTLRDILEIVDYDLVAAGNQTAIEGRNYPSQWVLAEQPDAGGFTPVEQAWFDAGQPNNLLDVVMPRQATLFMTSPDPLDPGAAIRSTTLTKDFLNLRAVAAPKGGLPIVEAMAYTYLNGELERIPLSLSETGSYWTTEGNESIIQNPIGATSSYVEFVDVAGNVQRNGGPLSLPVAQASSCGEVDPEDIDKIDGNAGKAIIFPDGDLDIPVEIYCVPGSSTTYHWVPQENATGELGIGDIVITDDTTAVAVGNSIMLRTTDRGRSWHEHPGAYPAGSWFVIDHNPDTGTMVASGRISEQQERIVRSDDGGLTWETLSGNFHVRSLLIHAGEGVWFLAGGTGSISTPAVIRSTDDGRTWTWLTFPQNLKAVRGIAFRDKDNGLVIDAGKIWRTTDGGDTWEVVLNLAVEELRDITYAGDSTWVAVQGSWLEADRAAIHRSAGDGAAGTWQSTSLFGLARTPSRVLFLNPRVGFIWTSNNSDGVPKAILRTDDAGLSWTEEQPASQTWNLVPVQAYDDNRILATGGPTGVAMTTSGGNGMPSIIVSTEPVVPERILSFSLEQNYPNPFAGETTLTFSLEAAGKVTLSVYDMTGREIERLVDGPMGPGQHSVQLDGSGLASGVYITRLKVNDATTTKRIMHVR